MAEARIVYNAGRRKIHGRVHDCKVYTVWEHDGFQWRLSSISREGEVGDADQIPIGYWTFQLIVRHHGLQLRRPRTPTEKRNKAVAAVKRFRIRSNSYEWKKEYRKEHGREPSEHEVAEAMKISVEELRDALRLRMGDVYGDQG